MQHEVSISPTAALPDRQPGEIYGTPDRLLATAQLSREEKLVLLAQWAADLEAKLRASDENMGGTQPGLAGDTLRQIRDAQRALAADTSPAGART